jgi:quinol monooxygenase YgiN
MPLTVIVESRIPDPTVHRAWVESLGVDETLAVEGCLSFAVYQDEDDPNLFVTVQEWESREQQGAYLAWRAAQGYVATTASFREGPAKVRWLKQRAL